MPPSRAPVVLVGLPGSGKSTVGRALAARLGWEFVDLDREIERRVGRSIPRIFAEEGEEGFRALELEATRALAGRDGIVVAPGGGWITRPDTVGLLRPPARLVYLVVSVATALARVRGSDEVRPLLAGGDPEAALAALLASREPLYRAADLAVIAEGVVSEVVTECEARLVTGGPEP